MSQDAAEFDAAVRAHDEALAADRVDVWIGAEPTFTRRGSESPEWLCEALGGNKQRYAQRILQRLHEHYPGSLVLRTVGRQYAGEERPRWNLGLYQRRDGSPLADNMPVDPLAASDPCELQLMNDFWLKLIVVLKRQGWYGSGFQTAGDMGLRVLFRLDGGQPGVNPQLAPRLIRYLNQHPALSYWFAPSYVGSFSQSPRADENVRESFSELSVALQQLAKTTDPQPEYIWRTLSPFLVDTSGNAHRSELNMEKLWNPYLPARGCLGLVEFRAFRMMRDPQSAASIAALLRAIVALLSRQDTTTGLIDWGGELHDRFALPFYLRQDLAQVLMDLESAGVGLGGPITRCLRDDSVRHIGHADISNCRLEVDQAIEFWPLLGDAASQEGGSSRLVDASTTRLQLSLRPASGNRADLDGWQLLAGGYRVPLRDEQDERGALCVMGLRYRSFVPWTGLHPGIGAQGPVVLTLVPPAGRNGLRITLHEWQPQGAPYQGLPATLEEAGKRRNERFVVEELLLDPAAEILPPPSEALSDYCLDLRRT